MLRGRNNSRTNVEHIIAFVYGILRCTARFFLVTLFHCRLNRHITKRSVPGVEDDPCHRERRGQDKTNCRKYDPSNTLRALFNEDEDERG